MVWCGVVRCGAVFLPCSRVFGDNCACSRRASRVVFQKRLSYPDVIDSSEDEFENQYPVPISEVMMLADAADVDPNSHRAAIRAKKGALKRPASSMDVQYYSAVFKTERGKTFYQIRRGKNVLVQVSTSMFKEKATGIAEQLVYMANNGAEKEELERFRQAALQTDA